MNKTFKNILYLFVSSVFSKLLGLISALIIPKILGPANYGVWVILLLIMAYAPIASLGTVEALFKEFPYLIGKKQFNKAKEYEENIFGSICLTSIFLFLCVALVPVIVSSKGLERYEPEVAIMLSAASISSFSGFFYFRLASYSFFKMCSIINTIRSISMLLFVTTFAWLFGLRGAAIGYLIVEVVVCLSSMFFNMSYCGKIKLKFNYRLIWQAIKIGLPITVIWWSLTLQSSIDRIVSSSFLGKGMTGYYSLGLSILSALALIPAAVSSVLYPKISEGVGKRLSLSQMSSIVIEPIRLLSIISPAFIGTLIILSPAIYEWIFPKYLPGLYSAQILFLGFFFNSLIRNGGNYLVALSKQNTLFGFVLISLVFNAVFAVLFVHIGFSIEGIALSTIISSALIVSLMWLFILKDLYCRKRDQWKNLFYLYSPFSLMLALLIVFRLVLPGFSISTGFITLFYVFIYLTFYISIVFLLPPFNTWSKEIITLLKTHIFSR